MTTATKYKTYPKYKPSGADWLGDIPDGWEAKRLRYFFDYHAGGVWGDEEKGDQNDLICLRVADFDFDHFALSDNDLTTRNIPENQHSRILEKGDILLEKSGGGEKQTVGRAVRFDSNDCAVCSNFIEKLTPLKVHNSKYISYLMGALYFGTINVRSIKQTTGIQNLDIYAYFSEVVPFPEKAIQKSITDFLDRETAKIDEMVEKKQKMIELLREKRQALITHAFTKGLDPKAKMKPSGIDWLGDIPADWTVKDLKYLLDRNDGGVWGEDFDDEGTPVLRSTEIDVSGEWKLDEFARRKLTPQEKLKALLKEGDLLITKSSGSELHIGKTALVNREIDELECCFSNFMQRLRPNKGVSSKLLFYFFNSYIAREQYNYFSQSTTGLANLSEGLFGQIIFVKIPESEQKQIVTFLDRETAKIDEMVKKVEMQIEKLQEYRQALITSAVTGKIMVN